MFRSKVWDKMKSPSVLIKEEGKLCKVCGERPLTPYKGPGSGVLCVVCQDNQVEYGGLGKLARPHTFHRNSNFVCDGCGWNVYEDERLADIPNEKIKHQVARILLHADHAVVRKADGGDDSAENIRSLCVVCHAKKTVLNNDNRRGNVSAS
jgi:hypothetical protein